MITIQTPLRPGLTAIAAVLALSSTPLFAQSIDAAPAAPAAAPVLVTPPPVTTAAPMVSAPTAAPTVTTAAPATTPAPLVFDDEPETAAKPMTHARTITKTATSTKQISTKPAPVAAPRISAPVEPVAPPAVAPVAAAPVAVVPAAPPPVVTRNVATQTETSDDILPFAGAGLAVLALAGGALALNRRRRRSDAEEGEAEDSLPVSHVPAAPFANPVTPTAAAHAKAFDVAASDGPVMAIPAGFDISRFGRHAQAAYRGPTPENPSLSLKRRLKRASFFDGRERMAAEGPAPMPAEPMVRTPEPPVPAREHLTVRAPVRPRVTFKPAFNS